MIPSVSDIVGALILVLFLVVVCFLSYHALKMERVRHEKDCKLKDLQIEWLQRVLGLSEKK